MIFQGYEWFDRFLDVAWDLGARPEWDRTGSKYSVAIYDGDQEPLIQAGPSLEAASAAFVTKHFPLPDGVA